MLPEGNLSPFRCRSHHQLTQPFGGPFSIRVAANLARSRPTPPALGTPNDHPRRDNWHFIIPGRDLQQVTWTRCRLYGNLDKFQLADQPGVTCAHVLNLVKPPEITRAVSGPMGQFSEELTQSEHSIPAEPCGQGELQPNPLQPPTFGFQRCGLEACEAKLRQRHRFGDRAGRRILDFWLREMNNYPIAWERLGRINL